MNSVTLTWSSPAVGGTLTAFYVTVSDGRIYRVPADQFGLVVTGLRNGVSATFAVSAATDGGVGDAASVTATPTSGVDGEVAGLIVKLEPGAAPVDANTVPGEATVDAVDLAVDGSLGSDTVRVEFSEATDLATAQDIARTLEADPAVTWAEPDRFVFTANDGAGSSDVVPNDTSYAVSQWNLWDAYGIGFGDGPTSTNSDVPADGGSGVTVAVIDTGITPHPDLDGRVTGGYDFVSDPQTLKAAREAGGPTVAFDGDYVDPDRFGALGWDANPADPGDWRNVAPERSSTWHGTQMAGVIAAQAGNSEGIVGVAAGAVVQPVRALSWRGGLLSDIAASITWASGGAVDGVPANPTPSRVLNLSFAVEASCPVSLQSAIDEAVSRGSVVVAAAGNANTDVAGFAPANCASVIAVGATGRDGKRAAYSNYGAGIDLSAPGGSLVTDGGVLSTSNDGTSSPAAASYATSEGTSIAAAQVSGAAARLLSASPSSTVDVVVTSLTGRSLRSFAGGACDADPAKTCGDGILSLAQIAATPTVTAPSTTPVFNVSTAGQDPGNFVIDGFAAGDTVLVTIGFVNPPSGTSFALPTRNGLTAGYGYDLTNTAMSEVAFTASQADANAALAAMTVATGSSSGNVTLQVSASLSIADVYYNPINKHFYEYVAQAGVKATDAFTAAAGKSRYGATGYMVTISNSQESDFIAAKVKAPNVWIGATDSVSEGVWKWNAGPEIGGQFWSGAASGYRTSFTDYTGMSVQFSNWCGSEPNDSGAEPEREDYAVTNWGSGTCWNDLNSTNTSSISGFIVEYGNSSDPNYTGVGSASMTAQVITEVTATIGAPSTPNGNYTQSFTVSFSHAAANIDATDFANGSSMGAAMGCVFAPNATSVNANTALSVTVYGCSAGKLKLKLIGSGITFSSAALEDTVSSEVTITSTGATPKYPSISGSVASVSGAWSSALDLGSVSIDASSCTVGNVTATVTSTAGTLAVTASGSATVTTVSATELKVTGSVTDVDSTLDSLTLAKTSAGTATVTTSIVPAANSTIGSDTYLFNPDNGHYYLVTPAQAWSWRSAAEDAAARSFCGAGGYIATLTSNAEYHFISTRALTSNIGDIWIGGQKTNAWRWHPGPNGPIAEAGLETYDQGSPAGSGPWHAGEPNNSGSDMQIYFTSAAYGWDDTTGSSLHRSLVEFGTNAGFTAPSTSVAVTFTESAQGSLSISTLSGTFGSPLTLATSGGSGTGAVTYAVSDGTATGCSVSGSSLSVTSAGTCLVTATKAADANYATASSAQTTVTMDKAAQSALSVNSVSGTFGFSLTLTTSGGSGTGEVTYAVLNGSASGCSVSGSSLSVTSAGTCLVTATKMSDTNYLAVSSTQTTVTFERAAQSALTVTSIVGTYGATLTLTTSGGSGTGSVTFAVSSGSASGCSVIGSSLSVTSAGTCLVIATKASDTNFLTASSSQTTVTFVRAGQSALLVTSTSGTYGSALPLTTSGGSGSGAVTYVATDGTATECAVNAGVLTSLNAGTCRVTATKEADSNYEAQTSAATIVTIAKADQAAITLTSTAGTYGSALTLTTSGGSGSGAVSFDVAAGTASGCSVTGGELTATSAGTCLVTVNKATDDRYSSALSVLTTVTFAKAMQVAVSVTSDATVTYGKSLTLTAAGGSGTGALAWSVASGTCNIAQSGSTWSVTTGDVGSACAVEATRLGDANHLPRTSAAHTITTIQADQSLTFTSKVPEGAVVGQSYRITATATSGLLPVLEVASVDRAVCTIADGLVTLVGDGVCQVRASQPGNANFTAALPLTLRFTVSQPIPSAPPAFVRDRLAEHMGTEPVSVPTAITSGTASVALVVNGVIHAVQVETAPQRNGWLLHASWMSLSIVVYDPRNAPQPMSADAHLVLTSGSQAILAGEHYMPDSRVKIFLLRDTSARALVAPRAPSATYIGDAIVQSDGSFAGSLTIPAGLAPSEYTLQINGISTRGEVQSIALAARIAAPRTPGALMRAGFFEAKSERLSSVGHAKIAALQAALPRQATDVRVEITGVSVSMPTLHANLTLASARAERLAAELAAQGVAGTYVVTVSTEMVVGDATAGGAGDRKLLRTVLKAADGRPLTTVAISFQAPST